MSNFHPSLVRFVSVLRLFQVFSFNRVRLNYVVVINIVNLDEIFYFQMPTRSVACNSVCREFFNVFRDYN